MVISGQKTINHLSYALLDFNKELIMDSKTAKENDRRLFKYFNERDMAAVEQWIDKQYF